MGIVLAKIRHFALPWQEKALLLSYDHIVFGFHRILSQTASRGGSHWPFCAIPQADIYEPLPYWLTKWCLGIDHTGGESSWTHSSWWHSDIWAWQLEAPTLECTCVELQADTIFRVLRRGLPSILSRAQLGTSGAFQRRSASDRDASARPITPTTPKSTSRYSLLSSLCLQAWFHSRP